MEVSVSRQEKVPFSVGITALGAIVVAALSSAYCDRPAHADPKPGLWLEQSTVADGVNVRKIRDTTGGDFNVCYVASSTQWTNVAPAISCIPERKP
jgi:hypothetical protein